MAGWPMPCASRRPAGTGDPRQTHRTAGTREASPHAVDGERDNRYDPWNTHGFDVDLDDGKMASLPWFAIESLEA